MHCCGSPRRASSRDLSRLPLGRCALAAARGPLGDHLRSWAGAGSRDVADASLGNRGRVGQVATRSHRRLAAAPPRGRLAEGSECRRETNDDVADTIGGLIRETITPPGVAAALYRVAALIPSATLVLNATNADGQHGIGIAWASSDVKYECRDESVFDKTTCSASLNTTTTSAAAW